VSRDSGDGARSAADQAAAEAYALRYRRFDDEYCNAVQAFLAGIAHARKEQAELVEALSFYATMQNFTHCSIEDNEYPNWMSGEGEYDIENGEVARQALAKHRGGE